MAGETREDLEAWLGDPASYVMKLNHVPMLRRWAIAAGHSPLHVTNMTGVELANLYHASAQPATVNNGLSTEALHRELVKAIGALNLPVFNVNLAKIVALDEIRDEIANGEAIRDLVANELERLAPRRLEIVTERSNIVLEGANHYLTEKIVRIVGIGHPIMMVGPAGCGKTTIAEHTARALDLPFYITSTINETHELTGFIDGQGKYHTTPFRNAFEFGGVWVADEIDAWDASALLAANSALANGYAYFPDCAQPIARHSNFRMVATANTFGTGADRVYIGRNELDAASLDRFAVVAVDYDLTLERMFAGSQDAWLKRVWDVRKIVNDKKIRHVVSSRAISMGAAALSAGLTRTEVEDIYLFKGMSKSDRDKIT